MDSVNSFVTIHAECLFVFVLSMNSEPLHGWCKWTFHLSMNNQFQYPCVIRWTSRIHLIQQDRKNRKNINVAFLSKEMLPAWNSTSHVTCTSFYVLVGTIRSDLRDYWQFRLPSVYLSHYQVSKLTRLSDRWKGKRCFT